MQARAPEFFEGQAAVQAQGVQPIGKLLKLVLLGDVFTQGELPELEAGSKADERDRRSCRRRPGLPKARSDEPQGTGCGRSSSAGSEAADSGRWSSRFLWPKLGMLGENAVASLVSSSPNAAR